MIQIRNITKRYEHIVLKNISYDFEDGKLYVIHSVSGGGKSTLLNILGGLETDYSGEYYLDGVKIDKSDKAIEILRSKIGYVFQESLLFSHLNIMDNLKFIQNEENEIHDLAQKLDVEHLLQKMPEELSNGERQRIAIIRALLNHPKILLADEPTSALDYERSKEIESIFYQLRDMGITLIICTHDYDFAKLADYRIQLDYGVIESTTTDNIKIDNMKNFEEVKHVVKIANDLRYSYSRAKKAKTSTTIMYTMMFFTLFFTIMMKFNFSDAVQTVFFAHYPIHVGTTSLPDEEIYKTFSKESYLYDDYHFSVDNYQVVGLFDKRDSSLSIPKALMIGRFPENKNEVLVNEKYLLDVLKIHDIETAMNKIIQIKEKKYTISGVLTSDDNILHRIYESGHYLKESEKDKATVFMPYDSIKILDTIKDGEYKVIVVPEALKDHTLLEDVNSYWYFYVMNSISGFNMFVNIFLIVSIAVSVIVFLFMMNLIRVDLMNRRREIGYLRLFSVGKKRIQRIVLFDYLQKVLFSVIYSNILLVVISIIVYVKFKLILILTPIQWLGIHVLVLLYIYLLTKVALKKILHKPIIELIKNT